MKTIPLGSERILFVDDEEALVEMGEDLLADLGYEVIVPDEQQGGPRAFQARSIPVRPRRDRSDHAGDDGYQARQRDPCSSSRHPRHSLYGFQSYCQREVGTGGRDKRVRDETCHETGDSARSQTGTRLIDAGGPAEREIGDGEKVKRGK